MDKKFVMSIAAMAALTLVSCSSDDLDSLSDNSSKNEAISFDGYLGRSAVAVNGTRGSEVKIGDLQTKGFGVFSKYNGSASFPDFANQKVTYSNKKWTYTPLKFWPTQGQINFYAYAPYKESKTLKENTTTFDFTVESKAANQIDLLWTNSTGHQIPTNSASTKEKVNFQFHHALSRLGYTVKLYGDNPSANLANNVTFTVNKITLAGSPDGTSKKAFYKTGTIDLSKANKATNLWSAETSDKNKQNYDLVSSNQTLDQNGINSDKNYLFVIPQDFSGADELYVYVEYTINYGGETESVKNTVYKQIKKKFEQGKAYMLNLTLGRPIEFDVDVTGVDAGVDGWGNEDGINIGSNDTPWER